MKIDKQLPVGLSDEEVAVKAATMAQLTLEADALDERLRAYSKGEREKIGDLRDQVAELAQEIKDHAKLETVACEVLRRDDRVITTRLDTGAVVEDVGADEYDGPLFRGTKVDEPIADPFTYTARSVDGEVFTITGEQFTELRGMPFPARVLHPETGAAVQVEHAAMVEGAEVVEELLAIDPSERATRLEGKLLEEIAALGSVDAFVPWAKRSERARATLTPGARSRIRKAAQARWIDLGGVGHVRLGSEAGPKKRKKSGDDEVSS